MATPAIQIVQISDLHLIEPRSLGNYFQYLSTLPSVVPEQVLQREDYNITRALPSEVVALCSGPSMVVLTGDISTWPGDPPPVINRHQYSLIQKMPRPLYPILGNHDWGPIFHATSYHQSDFQTEFDITAPRCELFAAGGVNVLLFMIDSNIRMFPSQGIVEAFERALLSGWFSLGRAGKLNNLSTEEYDKALKILLLHHMPLDRDQYDGTLGSINYWNLHLRDRPGLWQLCKDDIDLMLFGHTHVPLNIAWNGFLMVNCGTTCGQGGWMGVNNLQRLTIYDDSSVDVQAFNWNGLRFVAQTRSIQYRRGVASGAVLGSRRWG